MLVLIIAILTGIAVSILMYSVIAYIQKLQLEKRLKGKIDSAIDIRQKGLKGNLLFIAEKIGGYVIKSRWNKYLAQITEKAKTNLHILGGQFETITPSTFVGLQFLSGFAAMIVAVVVLDIYNIIFLLIFGTLGFFVPPGLLNTKVKQKHKAIFRQIPDVLDLLSLMIEAGLDFNNALNKVIESEEGTLTKELYLSQQEVNLGKSRADALNDMAERLKYLPLNTVVNSLTLSFKTGGSLAPALKALSEQFRVERSQAAEKMAAEAPLKLMLPLVLLIFPTIFIILFGPILLTFMGGGMW